MVVVSITVAAIASRSIATIVCLGIAGRCGLILLCCRFAIVGVISRAPLVAVAATPMVIAILLVFLLFIETGQTILPHHILIILLRNGFLFLLHQSVHLYPLLVEGKYFLHTVSRYCYNIGSDMRVRRILHGLAKDIRLEVVIIAVFCLKRNIAGRNVLLGLYVGVQFKIETAFQLGALSGEFLWIQRNFLIAGRGGGYRYKVAHPAGAAERSAARANTADSSSLLPRANLAHLNLHTESLRQHLDKLSEIHTLIGNVVENGLVAVSLIFHIANLHVQMQVLGNLAGLQHGFMFAGLGLLKFFQIAIAGNAVYLLRLRAERVYLVFLHLQQHQLSHQRHRSDVVSWSGLHCHQVALGQFQSIGVAEIALAGILESDLHIVGYLARGGYIAQPVEGVQLIISFTAATLTIHFAAPTVITIHKQICQ